MIPVEPPLGKLPRPVVFGLYGMAVGLLVALTVGELVWYLLRPPPAQEPESVPAPASVEGATPPPVPVSPHARLALTTSPRVSVYPGGTTALGVRIARDLYDGPVKLWCPDFAGLRAAEIVIPAGATSGQMEIAAAATAKPGKYRLTTVATDGQALSASAPLEVTVVALPAVIPRLAVSASPKVQAQQRGKNTFVVRVARGEYDGDVTVGFDKLPDGVTIPAVTVPAGKTEATAELMAAGEAKVGTHTIGLTARTVPESSTARGETVIEVLKRPKLPVDVVFVLDCTGSMKKTVDGLSEQFPLFAGELAKAHLDARFALVGFQDTTLGQPLRIPKIDGERLSADVKQFAELIARQRLGGGGGEGESSLDGIAEAADVPFRDAATRVLVLITDGGPKRVDGRMKSADQTVKYMEEKKIAQLQVVALPEHRKAFEPLWAGAKGQYFDLKATNAAGDFDKLMTSLGRAVVEPLPKRPDATLAPLAAAPEPVLPQVGTVKPPALPPGAEPDEPKLEKLPPRPPEPAPSATELAPAPKEQPATPPTESPARGPAALVGWASAVSLFVVLALVLGQMSFLPGEKSPLGLAAASYGVALVVGFGAGALGCIALGAVAGPLLARLAGGSLFGLGVGLIVPLAEGWFRADPLAATPSAPLPPPGPQPVALELPPLEPMPAASVPAIKPNITAPKPADGCPGCGRTIPGEVGKRYCMLCDATF